jgi:hypothetical protein
MRRSDNPDWVARSYDPKPVEGESEIDIILRNCSLMVFVEAKLGRDISLRTKYDPQRNQIVRNIDCVLDRAKGRTAIFWMVVRDTGEGRSYTQLLNHYRAHPDALAGRLPHHDPERVMGLARNLSLVLWKSFVDAALKVLPGDDAEINSINDELRSRV